jgi:Lysine methyltransferase
MKCKAPLACCVWLCSKVAAFSTIVAGGHQLKIAENAAVSPIGGVVWDASSIMCDHLGKLGADGQLVDQRILELGSGTGICGILAWAHGATGVLTDMDRRDKATGKHLVTCSLLQQ